MVTNFEQITDPLSVEEKKFIPIIISGFNYHKGKEHSIKGCEIIRKLKEKGYKINEARLRKVVNHIRSNSLSPICSTKKGYFMAIRKNELEEEIESLKQRASGIINAANGLKVLLKLLVVVAFLSSCGKEVPKKEISGKKVVKNTYVNHKGDVSGVGRVFERWLVVFNLK